MIELLEDRIAPATLISPTVVTYEDADGDSVTVKFSKPILATKTIANSVLVFDTGAVFLPGDSGIITGPQQLETIDLTMAGVDVSGISVTVKAKHSAMLGGDGYANVGAINAPNLDLGTVSIQGDLGHITAGVTASFAKPALKSLQVQSIGQYGLTTQAAGTATLESDISGPVTKIVVKDDVVGAYLNVSGSGTPAADEGAIGSVSIGGSLVAGDAILTGAIRATGKIGALKIGGDVVGGADSDTGLITANGTIGKTTIGGSLIGGSGQGSGSIVSVTGITSITVAHNLVGGPAGSSDTTGAASGVINGGAFIGSVKVGGSLIGGGDDSASIVADGAGGTIKTISIAGDLYGGAGEESAYVHAEDSLGPVTIRGSLIGGDGEHSASVYAGGSDGSNHVMKSLTIGHNVQGGGGIESASIGAVFGLAGLQAGLVIGKITIKGSVIGLAPESASVSGRSVENLFIGGTVYGGAPRSAAISFNDHITSAKIAGSLLGGDLGSGVLEADRIAKATIGHNVVGGTGDDSGSIFSDFATIGSLTIGGNLESGTGADSGSVEANGGLQSLVIKGNVIGSASNPVKITAATTSGSPSNFAPDIGKVSIGGSASFLQILAGFTNGSATPGINRDSIGTVTVGRDWIASSISASVDPGVDGQFGTADDRFDGPGATKIASIVIGHRVIGTVAAGDNFGFVAGEIDSLKIGALKFPKLATPPSAVPIPGTNDVTERTIVNTV